MQKMKRRQFIALIGGAATAAGWPGAAPGQQPKVPGIGWLSGRLAQTDALVLPAVRRGLESHGYVEGKNVSVEHRYAIGQYERLPSLLSEFVLRPVDLIVLAALDIAGYRAGKAATSTIPIVFVTGSDPV